VNRTDSRFPFLERVRDTFIAPARLFARFGEAPPWADVLALATLLGIVAVVAEPPEFYLDQMNDARTRRGEPVEIVSSPGQVVLFGRMMAALSGLVGHPLIAFAMAGALTLAFTVIGRGKVGFRRYLAVAAHAMLILSAGMLVALLLRRITGDANALPTLGTLLPVEGQGWGARVLGGINLFTVWTLGVIALGVAELERRLSRAGAATLLWGGYGAAVVMAALLFRA
jgi:Yip1 domain